MAAWYRAEGYEVLARNWRCRDGELDLVLHRDRTLVFCEVKTRRSDAFGAPVEAVTGAKQARLRRLAARWLAEEEGARAGGRGDIRFDVASVMGDRIDVIEAAF